MNSTQKYSVLLLAISLLLTSAAQAQFAAPLSVFGNGGSQMSGAEFRVRGTVGQGWMGVQTGSANRAYQGFWYAASRVTVAVDRPLENPIPGSFALNAIYPNPFNPSTQLLFSVPRTAHVSLLVFDMEGRRVATLAEQDFSAGQHSILWNADGFASGTYALVMSAPEFRTTRTMILLK